MKYVLVNHNFDPSWILNYTDDYLVYDRSDDGVDWCKELNPQKVIKTPNLGNVDYDKISYLVDNYYNLPDVFLWGKTNLFKYITVPEFEGVKDNQTFTPLLTQNHREVLWDGTRDYLMRHGTNRDVSFYKDKMYHELNNSWYVDTTRHYQSYGDFALDFGLPDPDYLPFAPGGNYILTKDRVHRFGIDFYERLRNVLPYTQLPSEAHYVERTYFTLWR